MATRLIPLTGKYGKGKFAKVDLEDYKYLNQFKWFVYKGGYVGRGVYIGKIDGKKKVRQIKMHREIMEFPDVKLDIDHKNHDKLDNRRNNLRICSHRDNMINCKTYVTNKSGYRGVHKYGLKWRAQIRVNGVAKYLGTYLSKVDAASAYAVAAKEYGYGN